ncbi:unnamed protein product [Didymodactylos carnosus]|uniref:Uncharacterized protein n=1 Tax=Didymodactylos carnosus TaxID=1234261 RepID=A0A815E0P8_9BILA|nr:unnamed protein product [Didymodactylos carnosus]CAF4136777.1 unnamed protein product [Didymodactylos carnosus]
MSITYLLKIIPMMVDTGFWLNSFISFERALIEYFNFHLYASRKRSLVSTFILIIIAVLTNLPDVIGSSKPNIKKISLIFGYIHRLVPWFLHVISSLFVLTNIARRKVYLSNQNNYWHVWFQQLSKHRYFFIPPIVCMSCHIPHIVYTKWVYNCIHFDYIASLRTYIGLTFLFVIPFTFTFLIYVSPSNIYMSEFRNSSLIGRSCLNIKRRYDQKRKSSLSETIITTRSTSIVSF